MTAPLSPTERHEDGEAPCVGQWCCGCAAHPVGKPWGWNSEAWDAHWRDQHGRAA